MQKRVDRNHWLIKTPIAHRGLHNISKGIPENSLAAFEKAADKNFAIELDVQLTKDFVPVVFHDFTLTRMTGNNKQVNQMYSDEIIAEKLLNTNEHIPTLREVLEKVDGKVPLDIEIKNLFLPGRLEDSVSAELGFYQGEVALSSFNPLVVSYLRREYPKYLTGLIIADIEKFMFEYDFTNKLAESLISPEFLICQVGRPLRKNPDMPIISWTVKSKDEEQKVRRFADNIIFENYLPE